MATTPNFEDIQDFSKKQLEAIASASSLWAKGLQDLAAEIDRLFEEGVRGQLGHVREASRRPQRRGRDPDLDRLRQAGVRGLCRAGEQGLRALRQGRLGRPEARHLGLREPAGQVIARSAAGVSAAHVSNVTAFSRRPHQGVGFFVLPARRPDSAARVADPSARPASPRLAGTKLAARAFVAHRPLARDAQIRNAFLLAHWRERREAPTLSRVHVR